MDDAVRTTRQLTYAQTTRSLLTVVDTGALERAAAVCLADHGAHTARVGNLPPAVCLDASAVSDLRTAEDVTVMEDPVLGAVWQLLACGRHDPLGAGLPGVRAEVANHRGDLGPWPPWPVAED